MKSPIYSLISVVDMILGELRTELVQKKIFPGIHDVENFYTILSHIELRLDPHENSTFPIQFREKTYPVNVLKDRVDDVQKKLTKRKEKLKTLRQEYLQEKECLIEKLSFFPWRAYFPDDKPLYTGLEIFLFPDGDEKYIVAHFEQDKEERTLRLATEPYTIEELINDMEEASAFEQENPSKNIEEKKEKFFGNILELHHPECDDKPTLVYLAVEKMRRP